jgi:hypothetical protein
MTARRVQGSALVEALVATALAGIALGGLTGAAVLATRSLVLVRDTANALALAGERLETLRVGPRTDGADAPRTRDGTDWTRSWRVSGGRGTPAGLSVGLACDRRTVDLSTEVFP